MHRSLLARRLRWTPTFGAIAALLLVAGACGSGDSSNPVIGEDPAMDPLGAIAFVDGSGCIARVTPEGEPLAAKAYCPESRFGVTFVSWIDSTTLAYVTPETVRLGWRQVDFAGGTDTQIPTEEAPRVVVFSQYGQPSPYSMRGERVNVAQDGTVSRVESGAEIPIFKPEGTSGTVSTRLATWSPDGEWVLLEIQPQKELWVVRRDGSSARKVAEETRGSVSWFMPNAGALPHPDVTCSVPTEQTLACQVHTKEAVEVAAGDAVRLSWTACPGVTGYEVQIFAPGEQEPSLRNIRSSTSYHEQLPAPTKGEWHWQVRALFGERSGPWSERRVLRVE